MDALAVYLALAIANFGTPTLQAPLAEGPSIVAESVVYFDAPIHSVMTIFR